jgi:hypothetical protein
LFGLVRAVFQNIHEALDHPIKGVVVVVENHQACRVTHANVGEFLVEVYFLFYQFLYIWAVRVHGADFVTALQWYVNMRVNIPLQGRGKNTKT